MGGQMQAIGLDSGGAASMLALLQEIADSTVASSTIGSGQKNVTTAGTALAIATSTVCRCVIVKAKSGNTGSIWVGTTGVINTTGYELFPLDFVALSIDNLSKVFIDASVSGEGVTFAYLV